MVPTMLPASRVVLSSSRAIRTSRVLPIVALNKSQARHITIQELDRQKDNRERIVILGSGWAGYTLARDIDPKRYQVVTVSPRSYFVFTPLLASTSTGTLEFRTAVEPVRSWQNRGEYIQGWGDGVDFDKKTLTIEQSSKEPVKEKPLFPELKAKKGEVFDMQWDKLMIAVGCWSQTFNTKGVKENAYFLKDVGDARKIRKRLLNCFETAALPATPEETKKQLLNFAVVGGGPTGIEWSAELHDIIQEDMKRLYPDLIKYTKITVYDFAPKVLSMFDGKLNKYAMDHFHREGISIKTNHEVEELRQGPPGVAQNPADGKQDHTGYTLRLRDGREIGIGMCVWSTGLMMNPFMANALAGQVRSDPKSGGVITDDRLRVKRKDGSVIDDVYALGDCAVLENTVYPATAQVASQQAGWLAKRLNKRDIMQHTFTYKNLGVMAYIGNWNAILQSKSGGVSGRVAWMIWRGAYLAKSVSWRNRILIPTYWFINWTFGRDISRF